jgi:phosphatidylinositol kinase/protein kinase (PI-3  family)
LIDELGNLFHIDFGYILGQVVSFDTARFAITKQLKEAMGQLWNLFVTLCVKAFKVCLW